MKSKKLDKTADAAYLSIAQILEEARATAYRAVNSIMVQAYRQIGRVIVEQEQKGRKRADYGKALIAAVLYDISNPPRTAFRIDITTQRANRERRLDFSILHSLRDELTWTRQRQGTQ